MNSNPKKTRRKKAFALVAALAFAAVSLVTLGGALSWTSSTAITTDRNNSYYAAVAAAEAASEKVLARISNDYQTYGEGVVYNSLGTYRGLVPNSTESGFWAGFNFTDGENVAGQTHVSRTTAWGYTNLTSQYAGLRGLASTYRIISNARASGATAPVTAAVRQEIQVASIPIFQFAIFYSMDLEINPGPVMNITGRVHSNAMLYTEPQATLTYREDVTAVGDIKHHKSPLDPLVRTFGALAFNRKQDSRVSSLTLPIGTNNSPAAVREVVELPPATGESASSAMGKQRYYNKTDLVIVVSNTTVTATSGNWNGFATPIPTNELKLFFSTNVSFRNARENKTVQAVQIDVGALRNWNATNTSIRNGLARDVSSIYVADKRTLANTSQSGVRLVNGQTLPASGLTVATPNPLYVLGHYNAPAAFLGTSNTTTTLPASLVGDSINVLSTGWTDNNSTNATRNASDTTVNAAFLGGIVPSNGTYYSGGVENFPRFLENWSNRTFTYNGSMVVMYYSQIATAPWGGSGVYSAPNRNWTFDLNFMDATKLPPGTPQVLATIRGSWKTVAPNTIL